MPANMGPYTPTPEAIVRECGLAAANVWGVVWRYCQMPGGTCWASQTTIGRPIGLSREAVRRHLRRLVEAGYLEDLTPDIEGRPHTYAATGRAGSADQSADDGAPQPPAPAARPPAAESRTPCHETSQPPATKSPTLPDHAGQPPAMSHRTPGDETSQPAATRYRTTCNEASQPPATKHRTKKDSKTEHKRVLEESQQDTRGVPPRVGGDDDERDEFDEQDRDEDEELVAEGLADFFARMTGIPVPVPRTDKQFREARTLWWAPLAQIASLCGSTVRGQRVIAAALAKLRGKGCIVKAPISILGTAQAEAGEQARKRASWQATNERYARMQRSKRSKPSPSAGPGRSSPPSPLPLAPPRRPGGRGES